MATPKRRITRRRRRLRQYYSFKIYRVGCFRPVEIRYLMGCVLEFYWGQIKTGGGLQLILEVCILYNLSQLIRQSNTVYFLAYKLFFLIYLGC